MLFEWTLIILGVALVSVGYGVFNHYTHTPNARNPKRLSIRPLDSDQFYIPRDTNSGLLHLPTCPPSHPIYMQAIRALYEMADLTYEQLRYIRDLQYTFELAMNAYLLSCYHEETFRLSAKFMEDMQLLASEMYAVARRLNLLIQIRFPRECDDPMLEFIKEKTREKLKKDETESQKAWEEATNFESVKEDFKFVDFRVNKKEK